MLYFGTLFNINYLNQGLSLYESLKKTTPDFKLFVLCLDSATYNYFKETGFNAIMPINVNAVESQYPELNEAKKNRSLVEYYFTLSPILPLYIITSHNNGFCFLCSIESYVC